MIVLFEATRMRRPPDCDDERNDLEFTEVSSAPPVPLEDVEVTLFIIPGPEETGSSVIDIRRARRLVTRDPLSHFPAAAQSLNSQVASRISPDQVPGAPGAAFSVEALTELPLEIDAAEFTAGVMAEPLHPAPGGSQEGAAEPVAYSLVPEMPGDESPLEVFPSRVVSDGATRTPAPLVACPPGLRPVSDQASSLGTTTAGIARLSNSIRLRVLAGVGRLRSSVARVGRGVARLPDAAVAPLAMGATRLQSSARLQVLATMARLQKGVTRVHTSVARLARAVVSLWDSGSRRVAQGAARLRDGRRRLAEAVAARLKSGSRRISEGLVRLQESAARLPGTVAPLRAGASRRLSESVEHLQGRAARLRARVAPLPERANRRLSEIEAHLQESVKRLPEAVTRLRENANRRILAIVARIQASAAKLAEAAIPFRTSVGRLSKSSRSRAALLTATSLVLAIVVARLDRAPLLDAQRPSEGETAQPVAASVADGSRATPVTRLPPGANDDAPSKSTGSTDEAATLVAEARRSQARAIPARTVAGPAPRPRGVAPVERPGSSVARTDARSGRLGDAPAAAGAAAGRSTSSSPGAAKESPAPTSADATLARNPSPGAPDADASPAAPASAETRDAGATGRSAVNQRRDTDGIEEVLNRLELAYTRLDPALAKTVWPTVNARALGRAFDGLRSQHVSFDRCRVNIQGGTGEAECRGITTYVPRVGGQYARTESRQWVFRFKKGDERWVITSAAAR